MIGRLAEPDDRIYDAVVVGAGPAGAMSAVVLAGSGASVLLVDRAAFPRYKVCGCCVNPRALATLREAGQGGLVDRLGGVPLSRFTLGCGGRRATISQALGVAVSRAAFDAALVSAAEERGATFAPETTASLGPATSPDFRELRLRADGRSRTVRGRFVVSATGLADTLREALGGGASEDAARAHRADHGSKIGAGVVVPGVPGIYPEGEIAMACGRDGYVGLVRLEDGSLNLAAAMAPEAVRRGGGIGPLAARILEQAGFPMIPDLEALPWKGTPPLTRAARTVASNRVFRVGDAAGYVEPFTGEGMAWALAAGATLAGILVESLADEGRSPERRWADAHRRVVTRGQLVCRAARLALRFPSLTGTLVRILQAQPRLAHPVLRSIHRTRTRPPVPWSGGVHP
ncbi:MAG: FAD-dependent monooxygenase [Isosphaeraceae bacterium]